MWHDQRENVMSQLRLVSGICGQGYSRSDEWKVSYTGCMNEKESE